MILNSKLNKAIKASLFGKYFVYIFQVFSLMVLSRIFTPEMFGQVALLQALTMFFQVVAVSGLVPAIIYQKKIGPSEKNGIFTCTLILGVIASFFYILVIVGYKFYDNSTELTPIIFFVCIFFSAASVVPLASLQKDANFKVISISEIIAEVFSLSISLVLYKLGFGLYALMAKIILTPIFRFFSYYYFSYQTSIGRANIGSNLTSIKPLLPFAKDQVLFNIFVYFSRNLDTLLIAKYFGATTLGLYDKTYQVVKYPLQLFTFAINPALQPILTKHKETPGDVASAYYSVIYKLLSLGLLCSAVIYFCAQDVIYLLFGEQWFGATSILQILCLSIPAQMVLSSTGGVFQAFGETKRMLKCGLFSGVLNIAAIVIGVIQHDLVFMCKLLLLSYIINLFQCFYVLHFKVFQRGLNISLLGVLFIPSSMVFLMMWELNHNTESINVFDSILNILYAGFLIGSPILVLYTFINVFLINKKN